jgi:hypothetical protein
MQIRMSLRRYGANHAESIQRALPSRPLSSMRIENF